jgi:hypothetical protein
MNLFKTLTFTSTRIPRRTGAVAMRPLEARQYDTERFVQISGKIM